MFEAIFGQIQDMIGAYEALFDELTEEEADEAAVTENLGRVQSLRNQFTEDFAPEELWQLFSDTRHGIDQISEIVLNLKNFSRVDRAAVDAVDVNRCLDSALLIAKNTIKHKAEVIRQYGELPPIRCAPSQINQVFLNLLTNAAQAIEGQGRITVRTQSDRNYVHVVIQDSGKGIAAEHLSRIFDPFFTTKPVGQGTGLGLSISQKIIQDHGGAIRVKSEPGRGTAFCVSLPVQRS